MAVPEWLIPGAEVVIDVNTPGSSRRQVLKGTVKSVATKSFTVTGFDGRFSLIDFRHRTGAYGTSYKALHADTDDARDAVAAHNRQRSHDRAESAVHAWQMRRTPENRAAAIAALQAVED